MLSDKAKSALAGAAAGVVNGFFGAGGGMVLVPLLIGWVKMDQRKAFASSVFIILPLCAVSAVVYLLRTEFDFLRALPYLIGGLVGGFIGGKIFGKVPTVLLHRLFGILLIAGGVRSIVR